MYGLDTNIDFSFMLNKDVIQICVGVGQVVIHFNDGISIYSSELVSLQLHEKYLEFRPKDICDVKYLLDLLDTKVVRIINIGNGDLEIEFSNSYKLKLYDNAHYESYIITCGDNEIIV